MKVLDAEEVNTIRNILKNYPEITPYLGEEWVEKNLLTEQERKKVHPMAWILLDPQKNDEFLKSIQLLIKAKYPKLSSLLRDDLKKAASLYELRPFYTELQLYRSFSKKIGLKNTRFRPALEESGTESDLEITIDDKKIFVEILTVIDDEVSIKQTRLSAELNEEINKLIEKRGIVVTLFYRRLLDPSKVKCILEELKLHQNIPEEKTEIAVLQSGQEVATIEIEKNDRNDEGYMAGEGGPGRGISVGNREKNKILDKLDKYQFPKNADIKGIIVHLDTMLSGESNILNAILGVQVLKVNIETGKTLSTRDHNGIIHDTRAAKIDFIAYYRRGDVSAIQLLMNNDETGLVKKLFNIT